jgi:hypothetical protein
MAKRDIGAVGMDVDTEGEGKDDGKDGKDAEDGLGASLGRYTSCAATHHACGVCKSEYTGSHNWWYSNKIDNWLCSNCQATMYDGIGWMDKAKKAKDDYDKDKNTGGCGGGAGDTEMCVS